MNKKQIYFKKGSGFALLFVFTWTSFIFGCGSPETADTSNPNANASNQTSKANSRAETGNIQPMNTSPTPMQSLDGKISKQELGAEYPFTVDQGVLGCEGAKGSGLVTFTANGKTYTVNKADTGPKKRPPIDSIWADDPANPGKKIIITPIIQRGMQLCK